MTAAEMLTVAVTLRTNYVGRNLHGLAGMAAQLAHDLTNPPRWRYRRWLRTMAARLDLLRHTHHHPGGAVGADRRVLAALGWA